MRGRQSRASEYNKITHNIQITMTPFLSGIFGLQGTELWIIVVLVLLLFGAKKLPELARGLGKSMGEFKRAKDEFDTEMRRAGDEIEAEKKKASDTQPS
jgi:sec-independent protein translocase protein TatA